MASVDFESRIRGVLRFVGERLTEVWHEFGQAHFPADGGEAFRDQFIAFAHCAVESLCELQEPDEAYSWFSKNSQQIANLETPQFIRLIGALHFYATTTLAIGLYDGPRYNGPGAVRGLDQLMKALDWIFNTYDFPASEALEWFELTEAEIGQSGERLGTKLCWEIAKVISDGEQLDDSERRAWLLFFTWLHFDHAKLANSLEHKQWCQRMFAVEVECTDDSIGEANKDEFEERAEEVAEAGDGWPRLPQKTLSALPRQEQIMIRQHEEETIAGNSLALVDICSNCHDRLQFAKTYRVLRQDLRETLDKMRAKLTNKPRSGTVSDACVMAFIVSHDKIINHKLDLMAEHFYRRWGQPIGEWAGEKGSAADRTGTAFDKVFNYLFGW